MRRRILITVVDEGVFADREGIVSEVAMERVENTSEKVEGKASGAATERAENMLEKVEGETSGIVMERVENASKRVESTVGRVIAMVGVVVRETILRPLRI